MNDDVYVVFWVQATSVKCDCLGVIDLDHLVRMCDIEDWCTHDVCLETDFWC